MMTRRDVLATAGMVPLTSFSSMTSTQGTSAVPHAAQRRRELYGLLGKLPDRKRPIGGRKRREEERDG